MHTTDSPYIVNVTRENFDDAVLQRSREVPVLVDFWADWCGPCHMLMPILTKLAEEYAGQFILAKVNTDEQQALAAQWGVRSLPTVKLFKNGQVVDEFMGAQPESAVRALLDRHIERESDRLRHEARALMEAGEPEAAEQLLRKAADMDPANVNVRIDLARALMLQGETEAATEILDALPPLERDRPEVRALKAEMAFAHVAAQEPDLHDLQRRVAADPDDLDARYALAAHQILRGDYEAGMEQLLAILERDRGYRDGAARTGMLAVFDRLGPGETVNRYRSRLFALLH